MFIPDSDPGSRSATLTNTKNALPDTVQGSRREEPTAAGGRPSALQPPHATASGGSSQQMAGSGAAYNSNSTALSLVGALRRLGTRVNLVPVNFSSDSSR
jgi:hypothetical protein